MASAIAGPQAFLVGGVRTPVGRYGGALSAVRPDDLAALVLREAISRAGLDPDSIDEVILGNANGAGEENRNVARMATVLAGLPLHIPGITVNRLCASGLSAIIMASHMIKSGAADIVIAGGVESMSRAPWVQEKPRTAFAKPGEIFDTSIGWRFVNPLFEKGELSRDGKMTYSMPETAEEVARVDGISREDADAFAVRSHERALAAIEAGRFADEIVPVTVRSRKGETIVDTDEGPRPGTTMDVLAGLRPVVAGGSVVTAGNSSTLNDGASAIIVASEAAIEKLGLTPRARIIDGASAGCEPEIMGIGPVPATRKVLARSGLERRRPRRRRTQRSVRHAVPRQHAPARPRPGDREPRRRRDRPRPPAGLLRIADRDHPARPDGTRRRKNGPRHHVHRRRPGHRHAAGARLMPGAGPRPRRRSPPSWSRSGADRLVVLLNRPEVRNAIDQDMVDELHRVCAALEREPKVLIIAGSDGVFASGADISQLRERRRDDALQGINSTIFVRIAKLPMPVIAALDGFCLGGGAELAYAADFRIGTPGVRIGNPETGLGILAAAGASWRLKELVGEPVAKEILLAGVVLGAERGPRRQPHHRDPRGPGADGRSPPRSRTGSPGRIPWPCGSPSPCSTPRPRRTR